MDIKQAIEALKAEQQRHIKVAGWNDHEIVMDEFIIAVDVILEVLNKKI